MSDPVVPAPEGSQAPSAPSADPESAPGLPNPQSTIQNPTSLGTLSQSQLIRLRFAKHKVAVVAMRVLAIFYLAALFAEFLAPYPINWRDLDHAYCPPQLPRVSLREGLYVHPMVSHVDPITLRRTYHEDRDRRIPLRLLVRGAPVRLWGRIPIERRLFGPAWSPEDLARASAAGTDALDATGEPIPSFHFLGADKYGRDLFSRLIYGSRISLSIGLVSVGITFVLGLIIGGISGYVGGRTDTLIQRAIEIINAFPSLPLWLALGAVLPPDWPALKVYFAITVVLSLLNWTGLARVVRGKILSLREEDYAVAARLLGANHGRILFRHLMPGFASHIIVTLTLSVPGMILGETALSFLGLGLRPPIVSWGVMLQDCLNMQAVANYPWLLVPVFPIILVVLAFNFFGDGLRDAADPYGGR